MISYIADNQKAFRYIYSNMLELFTLLIFVWLGKLLFSDGNLSAIIIVGYTIYFLIRFAWADRIKQLVFDQEKNQLIVYYTHFFEKKAETFLFDEVKIKVLRKKPESFRFLADPISIFLYIGEREYAHFELNENKDGFSIKSLEEIAERCKSLSIPVTEKLI